jgi:adenylate cyclase
VHHGKWLKEMGDGTLASVKTTSDAGYCAGALMEACKAENISLRIGMHQGEIVEEDGDIFGDGVNVASRIEPLAEPGQILVSGPIHRNVKNKEGVQSTLVRETELKNVDEPVRLYQLEILSAQTRSIVSSTGITKARIAILISAILLSLAAFYFLLNYLNNTEVANFSSNKKSIIVLPFENDSPNKDDDYLCDGLMKKINLKLSRMSGFEKVITWRSAIQYKGSTKTTEEIVKEQDVTLVLEGSVRKLRSETRIIVQLYDGVSLKQLWAGEYAGEENEILDLEQEVALDIANYLALELSKSEIDRLAPVRTDLSAYDYYFQANKSHEEYLLTKDSLKLQNALFFYKKVLEIDSTYSDAYGDVAMLILEQIKQNRQSVFDDHLRDTVLLLANKAITYNDESEKGYLARALYYIDLEVDVRRSKRDFIRALEINPNSALAYRELSNISAWHDDDYLKAIQYLMKSMDIVSVRNHFSNA